MPTKCSLWLLPHNDSPIYSTLSDLITTKIPSRFPKIDHVTFEPHVTLTSDVILPSEITTNEQAQRWLDDMPLPRNANPDVRFESLEVGPQYFKKLILSVEKGPLETLGTLIRTTAVEKGNLSAAKSWAKETWAPHVSLMYAEIEITAEKRQETLQVVTEAGICIGKEYELLEGGNRDFSAWSGSQIALIETWKKPSDWKVIASRAI